MATRSDSSRGFWSRSPAAATDAESASSAGATGEAGERSVSVRDMTGLYGCGRDACNVARAAERAAAQRH